MLHCLPGNQTLKAAPLFTRLAHSQPMVAAVLEGVYPGKVYGDDPEQPRTALLTTAIESEAHGVWCFLAGDPANAAFNQALNAAIFAQTLFAAEVPVLFFTADPDDWGGQYPALFAPRPPVCFRRYHFIARRDIARRDAFDWRAGLPEGFTVEPLEPRLRKLSGLQLPEDVATTLAKWERLRSGASPAGPGFKDFGFVTLDRSRLQPAIASWATVDFVTGSAGDLGFFTRPEYRRRNLGLIAVSAALEHAFESGLQQVNWTCDADNPGSIRTAEKLGLERIEDYTQALLVMDEEEHLRLWQESQAAP